MALATAPAVRGVRGASGRSQAGAYASPCLAARSRVAGAWTAGPTCRRASGATSAVVMAAAPSQDELKKQAAWKAVEYVKSGMKIGLGTGSTAAFAVDRIGQLLKEGKLKDIVAVPTSVATKNQAEALGIPLATLATVPVLDVAIDGSDEVDPQLNLVKGRGGALLREKMVELASKKFVCIVDDSKLVTGLGGSKLAMPVEVTPFCYEYNMKRLPQLPEVKGCTAKLRMKGEEIYVTDNGNYIVDLYFETPMKDAVAAGNAISALVGVVEHGLFLNMCDVCIIAGKEGITVQERKLNRA